MSRIFAILVLMCVALVASAQERYLGYGEMVVERSGNDSQDFQFAFGRALAKIDGHYFVGAAGGNAAPVGTVFVYEQGADGWTLMQSLASPDVAQAPDRFGLALVAAGDHLAVGAPFADAGKVFIHAYDAAEDEWVAVQTLTEPDGTADARFGSSLAFANGRLYVGAPSDWTGADGPVVAGRVFVYEYDGATEEWVESAVLDSANVDPDGFGAAVAASGDTVVVGAPIGAGAVHYYDGLVLADSFEDAQSGRWFGRALAVAGSRVLVGAVPGRFSEFSGGMEVGAASLLDATGGALNEIEELSVVDANGFGLSVALLDDGTALVSAPVDNEVFMFREDGGDWSLVQRIVEPRQSQFSNRGFGETLFLDGDGVLVGVPASHIDRGSAQTLVRGGNLYRHSLETPPFTDLAMAMSAPATVPLGETFDVDMVITNDSATDVGAAFVTLYRNRFDHTFVDPVTIDFPDGCTDLRFSTIRCELGAIAAGDTATLTLTYRVAVESLEQHYIAFAYAGSEYADPDTRDNDGTVTVGYDYSDAQPPPAGGGGGGGGHIGGALIAAMLGLYALRRRLRA